MFCSCSSQYSTLVRRRYVFHILVVKSLQGQQKRIARFVSSRFPKKVKKVARGWWIHTYSDKVAITVITRIRSQDDKDVNSRRRRRRSKKRQPCRKSQQQRQNETLRWVREEEGEEEDETRMKKRWGAVSPGQKEVNERQLQFSGDAQIVNCFYSPKSSSLSALSAPSAPVFSSLTPPCYSPPTQAFPWFSISPTAPPTWAPVPSIYIWQREKRRRRRRRRSLDGFQWMDQDKEVF